MAKLKLHLELPEFPGRRLFGSTNKSEEAVLERQKGLVHVYIYIMFSISTNCYNWKNSPSSKS